MEQLTGENLAAKLQEFLYRNNGDKLTHDYILELLFYIKCAMDITDNQTFVMYVIDMIKQFHWERSQRYAIDLL